MLKTVLMVSYFTPPLINAESILVWKTLCEMSSHFEVKVLTSVFADNARVDPHMTIPQNVQVFRMPTFKPANKFLRKLSDKALGMVSDEEYLWASLSRLEMTDYDLIYSRSHPGASHILAYRLKQQTRKPWVAQFSDPWTRNPYHTNHTWIRRTSDTHWEAKVVRHADFLVFPTKEILDLYTKVYPSLNVGRKSTVLPHHYIPDLYNGQNKREKKIDNQPAISFAYFGDFYGVRSPEPFIKAIEHIAHSTPALLNQVKVNFYGNVESKFADLVDKSPVTITRSRVTYFDSLNLMTNCDVLLLIDAPSSTGVNPFLASKLVDYLGAGKRILGITDEQGTSADILRKYGHYVISPHDISKIAVAIRECIATPQFSVEPPALFTTKNVVGRLVHLMHHLDHGVMS